MSAEFQKIMRNWAYDARCPKCGKAWSTHKKVECLCEENEKLRKLLSKYVSFFQNERGEGFAFVEPEAIKTKDLKREKPKVYGTPAEAIDMYIKFGSRSYDAEFFP